MKTLITYGILLILCLIAVLLFIEYVEKTPPNEFEYHTTTVQAKRQELECLIIDTRTTCSIEYYVEIEGGEIKISYDFYQKAIVGNEILIKRRIK